MQRLMMKHQQAVKRIIRYIAGTLDHGLYCLRCLEEEHLVGYNNTDYTGDIDTNKSTSGILFFGKCLVSGQSVKQHVVALFGCETEYIAASTASTQALCLVRLLGDLSVETLERWNSGWTASPLGP
jgi:aminopeptidase-like protein